MVAMNSLERLVCALQKKAVDRPPVAGPMVSISKELMDRVGIHLPAAHQEAALMGELSAAAFELCGLESLKVPFDLMVEVEALDGDIDFGDDKTLPTLRRPFLSNPGDLKIPADFMRLKRVPLVLEAIGWCRRRYGNTIPVISSIVGPYTLAGFMYGLEKVMMWMLSDATAYAGIMDKLTELAIQYAQAQFAAGAHVVQAADPMASGDLISPNHYASFVAPYHRKLFASLTGPSILHICGNITGHLPHIREIGVNGLSFDEKTDISAASYLKEKIALVGFVPTSVLQKGHPEEVRLHSERCIKSGVDVLSPGCALHLETSIANIRAMVQSVQQVY
jgi:[methyl-Co(III) methanol-specific corrinoid protein]:coenzyme M methyltransferase